MSPKPAVARTIVSIDLDGIDCYHQIHGLPPASKEASRVVLERALPRFMHLLDKVGGKATFFVIGRELDADRERGSGGWGRFGGYFIASGGR